MGQGPSSQNVSVRYDESEQVNIASISPGESCDLTWHIVPNQTGLFRLIVTANGDDENDNPAICIMRMNKDVSE